jgi:hypothetical protein
MFAANDWIQVDVVGPVSATSANTMAGIYLTTDNSTTPTNGLTCDLGRSMGFSGTLLEANAWTNGVASPGMAGSFGVVSEVWVSAQLGSGICLGFANGAATRASTQGLQATSSQLALHTSNSTAQFKSVTVFSGAF